LGQDIIFWSVGVSGVLVSAKNLGFLFSGSKSALPNMKICALSTEKSEKNRGWVVMTLGNEFPNMGIVAMQK
jgi:hypothetical protein